MESILASETRITELLAARDATHKNDVNAVKLGLVAEGDDNAKLMPLVARQDAASRELYIATREMLHHLRMTWGSWTFGAGSSSIHYFQETDQKAFVRLAEVISQKTERLADIAAEIRARQGTRLGPG
ncbi:MAG TPA: hypothetical protein VH062_09810 [Polyangiaceae bacterium]|nr:hypothetical protein [Polyangiaceae bacterium]